MFFGVAYLPDAVRDINSFARFPFHHPCLSRCLRLAGAASRSLSISFTGEASVFSFLLT